MAIMSPGNIWGKTRRETVLPQVNCWTLDMQGGAEQPNGVFFRGSCCIEWTFKSTKQIIMTQ